MSNTKRTVRKKAKVRYDRIIITAAVLLLVILLIRSCAGKDEKAKPAVVDPIASSEAAEDNSKAVYLSPSNQTDNFYAAGENITEASAMRDLGNNIKDILEENGVTVYIAGKNDTLEEKVSTANELGVGAYVAVHSNAGGESGNGQGTECFYNPDTTGSKTLAEYVYNNAADLTPTEDRGIKSGTDDSHYLYEVDNPKMANCLLEVEFHDTAEHAQWIIDNKDKLAQAVANGIMKYLHIDKPESTTSDEVVSSGSSNGDE